jgi:hypothetical protein
MAAWVHWSQENDRVKMHQNVLNDIAKEQAELMGTASRSGEECSTGLCDLKTSRITTETS